MSGDAGDRKAILERNPNLAENLAGYHVYPARTPYRWMPTSLTHGGWYEEVAYKSLVMMNTLGMQSAFYDDGFSNLGGVDYTGGRARSIQPCFWRMFQDLARWFDSSYSPRKRGVFQPACRQQNAPHGDCTASERPASPPPARRSITAASDT